MTARRRRHATVVNEGPSGFIVEDIQHGWHIQAWIELQRGELWITELRLRPANGTDLRTVHDESGPREYYPHDSSRPVPPGGITTTVLRKLSTMALYGAVDLRALRTMTPDEAIAEPGGLLVSLGGLSASGHQDLLALRRSGRRKRTDLFYAEWAGRYAAKCEKTPRPYPELERENPGYNRDALRGIVQEARRRGLLIGGSHGRAGGRLSEKATSLLKEATDEAKKLERPERTTKRRTQ